MKRPFHASVSCNAENVRSHQAQAADNHLLPSALSSSHSTETTRISAHPRLLSSLRLTTPSNDGGLAFIGVLHNAMGWGEGCSKELQMSLNKPWKCRETLLHLCEFLADLARQLVIYHRSGENVLSCLLVHLFSFASHCWVMVVSVPKRDFYLFISCLN